MRKVVSPLGVLDLVEAVAGDLERAVVDQDVEAAEAVHGGGDDVAAMGGVADVAGDLEGLAAGLLDVADGVVGILLLVEIGEDHVGALAGEG